MRHAHLYAAAAVFAACLAFALAPTPGPPAGAAVDAADDDDREPPGAPAPAVRAVQARIAAKERAAAALLAGGGTLLGAAARFRELDAAEPRVRLEDHPDVYAGDTEAERYCRAVVAWADNAARAHAPGAEADEARAVVRRLEEEMEGHRRCGTLELPPP